MVTHNYPLTRNYMSSWARRPNQVFFSVFQIATNIQKLLVWSNPAFSWTCVLDDEKWKRNSYSVLVAFWVQRHTENFQDMPRKNRIIWCLMLFISLLKLYNKDSIEYKVKIMVTLLKILWAKGQQAQKVMVWKNLMIFWWSMERTATRKIIQMYLPPKGLRIVFLWMLVAFSVTWVD